MFRLFAAWLSLLSAAASSITGRRDDHNSRSIIYVQTFKTVSGGKLSLLPLIQQETKVSHVYLAALHINRDPGDINLNDENPNATIWDPVWSEAAQLQQSGVKVMFMLGGAAPGSYPRLCSGNVISEDYYIPLRDTIDYHKIDGLDLDIEERIDIACPLALLRRLHEDFGSDFILTMAPVASDLQPAEYGLGGFSYSLLDSQAIASDKPNGKLVNWYNTQFYNGWGDASTPIGYNAIIENGYSPDGVVFGVLDSNTDGGSGWYSVSTYQKTIKTLRSNYADFGGDVGWEYWDAGLTDKFSDPWKWAKEIGAALLGTSSMQKDFIASPINYGPNPWPSNMQTLLDLGSSHLAAVRALNLTSGNLNAALGLLSLSDLAPLDR